MSWFRKKKATQTQRRKAPPQKRNPNKRPAVATYKGWKAESASKQQRLAEQLKTAAPPTASPRGKTEAGIKPCTTNRYAPEVLIRLFLREDCSWCRKFYTHPTECPSDRYGLEKCDQYEQIYKDTRSSLIETPLWQVVIREAMSKKVSPLPTRKCHYCGKLNPDPEMINHWKCVSCGSKL
jgi:hypothetical protein